MAHSPWPERPLAGRRAGTLLTGLGAVVLTYFGLREFTPVRLPD